MGTENIKNSHMFKKETYIARREQLRKDVGRGIIILPGNHEAPCNYKDNTYWFRQDSTFLYFFGQGLPLRQRLRHRRHHLDGSAAEREGAGRQRGSGE